jgi:hypothetical protein
MTLCSLRYAPCSYYVVGQIRVGANLEKNFGFELEPILAKGMGFLFLR